MASTSQQAALARRTILFVDDEPLSQKYFKASVGQYANVLTASTSDAALKILTSGGDPISVVVSDERMPHESGVSFLTNVRKSFPSTVRILTSAYADIENLQQAINGAAIYRFVPKPWDFDELCSAMQEALVAERVAETVAAPLEGRLGAGNAESANMELLAVLARELATPLDSLDKEALQLSLLTQSRCPYAEHALADRFLVVAVAPRTNHGLRGAGAARCSALPFSGRIDRRTGGGPLRLGRRADAIDGGNG